MHVLRVTDRLVHMATLATLLKSRYVRLMRNTTVEVATSALIVTQP